MAQPGQFEVGQLYYGGKVNGLPVWTQPGGPGTPVYPQLPTKFPTINIGFPQAPMAYPAYYYFGCGHPLNTAEVFETFDPYAQKQVALICCPMCSYIQQIKTYGDYQNYVETPIVVA